ncbi:MAG: lamin tail domain-containing protein [Bacteroidales bacterium]|nr:lamin tail domain-containing protein [Bacteroidales bacterium]
MKRAGALAGLFVFLVISAFGQIPPGYYDDAQGLSGEELKTALNAIIDDHIEYQYTSSGTDLWDILKDSDEDPSNPDNVILFYTGWSVDAEQEYNNGNGWSREHVWAQSHGGLDPDDEGPGTDAHHLRPCDISVNSARSNKDFDNGGEEYLKYGTIPTGCYSDENSWEPRDEVKGDVARMIFYMVIRYEDYPMEIDLEAVDEVNTAPDPEHGKLSTLLEWHQQDPPNDFELNRNEVIYDYQENRNPFIDHPEYVSLIWGENTTDTLIVNEIMYNSEEYDEEWIELYNPSEQAVDLSNWTILDDDLSHDPVVLPQGAQIAGNGYFTVSIFTNGNFPFDPDYDGTGHFALNNDEDEVNLYSPTGQLIDHVPYQDNAPWPTAPDGSGSSLSLLEPELDNSQGENWAGSEQNGGTPGQANFPNAPLLAVTSPNGGVTLYFTNTYAIEWTYANLSGQLDILLKNGPDEWVLAESVPVEEGSWQWTVSGSLPEDDQYVIELAGEGISDESDASFSIQEMPGAYDPVITEIMYNPPESGQDSLEFIEIYNPGSTSIDMTGYYFSEGISYTFPGVILEPGSIVLIAKNGDAFQNTFGIEAMEWNSGALSNSGEAVELKDQAGNLVDLVDYDDGGSWPSQPDSYGPSLEIIDPENENDDPANWKASEHFIAVNAEGDSIWASPGFGGEAPPQQQSLQLGSGYQIISSHMIANDPDMLAVMAPLLDNGLQFVRNSNGDMLHKIGPNWINNIGDWNTIEGYLAKMNAGNELVIEGDLIASDTPIPVQAGFQFISFLPNQPMDALTAMQSILGHMGFMRNTEGDMLRKIGPNWVNNIGNMQAGEGYMLKMEGEDVVVYP